MQQLGLLARLLDGAQPQRPCLLRHGSSPAQPAPHALSLVSVLQPAPPVELAPPQTEGAPFLSWGGRVKHRLATRVGPAPVVELFSASAFVPAGVHERLPPCIYVNDLATREQVPAPRV